MIERRGVGQAGSDAIYRDSGQSDVGEDSPGDSPGDSPEAP